MYVRICVRVCLCACMCACMCVHACVHACVSVCLSLLGHRGKGGGFEGVLFFFFFFFFYIYINMKGWKGSGIVPLILTLPQQVGFLLSRLTFVTVRCVGWHEGCARDLPSVQVRTPAGARARVPAALQAVVVAVIGAAGHVVPRQRVAGLVKLLARRQQLRGGGGGGGHGVQRGV